MQPSRPNSTQPGRAPAPPDSRTPPVSGSPLSCALSPLSLAAQWGRSVGTSFLHPRAHSLSASRARFASCRAVAPRVPFSFSALWACPVSSAPLTLAVDRRVRTRARRRVSRPRCPPTRPAPFLEPASAPRSPLASFRTASPSLALCPHHQPPPENRARVLDRPGHRRPRQASPSSAMR
jgi:hypothetical protein